MPTFGSTFGAMFITVFVDAFLYGIAMLLFLQYYHKSFKDHWTIKVMVGTLGFLASLQSIFWFRMIYKLLIVNFGNYPALNFLPWDAFVQVTAIFLIAVIAQCFFMRRIWKLCKSKVAKVFFTAPIMILCVSGLVTGLMDTILVARDPRFSYLASPTIRSLKIAFCVSASLCDITITAVLWILLHRSRTGIRSTENMLNTLIIQAVNRGAVTSLVAVLYLVLYLSMPNDAWFMIFMEPMAQHYVISVLSMLNSRVAIRETMTLSRERAEGSSIIPLSSIPQTKTVEGGIHVSTSVVTWEAKHQTEHDSDKASNNDKLGIFN